MGIASMILGILALLEVLTGGFFGGGFIGVIFGVVAVVLGAAGKKTRPEMATAGIATGIIAIILGTLLTIACVACAAAVTGAETTSEGMIWDKIIEWFKNLLK